MLHRMCVERIPSIQEYILELMDDMDTVHITASSVKMMNEFDGYFRRNKIHREKFPYVF